MFSAGLKAYILIGLSILGIRPLLAQGATPIAVNIAYSVSSKWTETEIRQRFKMTAATYAKACPSVELQLAELVRISDPDLQDIQKYETKEWAAQLAKIDSLFQVSRRPTIFFARRSLENPGNELYARAFTLGGPRPVEQYNGYPWNQFTFDSADEVPFSTGNLDWNRLSELRHAHGFTVIVDGYSMAVPTRWENFDRLSVEAHELGHILLNDESHRPKVGNIMGDRMRGNLDSDQCDLVRAYPRL